ncbi:MAG: T9SS type A sorting domain-containing protein, partial [Candidatus Cloacimonetes bacterium]|nr:T9SS type A sorting domain-containing protein [Candidatus Cloacimonadota bacterium]
EATNVKIQIYNIRGQLVAELVNGFEAAGRKQIEWDANKYVNGIYFYKMETNNNTFIKKMVLLR